VEPEPTPEPTPEPEAEDEPEPIPEPTPEPEPPAPPDDYEEVEYFDTDEEPPLADAPFEGRGPLLFAPWGTPAWALLNLIMTICGAILVIFSIIRLIMRKKEEDREEEDKLNELNDPRYAAARNQAYENRNYIHEEDEDEEETKEKKFRKRWFILEAIGTLLAIIIFILTQDMRLPMALTDWWTLIHLIILVITVIAFIKLKKRKKDEDEDEDEEEPTPRVLPTQPHPTR